MSHDYDAPLSCCGPIDLFVDVGVAKPDTEAWRVRDAYPNATIIGFEPYHPHYLACLDTYPGLLFPYAVGNAHDIVRIGKIGPDNAGVHFNDRATADHSVARIRLDNFIDGFIRENARAVLWADVEGAELEVLIGAEQLLYECCFNAIVLEVRDANDTECGADSWVLAPQVERFLLEHGYRVTDSFVRDVSCNSRDIVAKPA